MNPNPIRMGRKTLENHRIKIEENIL